MSADHSVPKKDGSQNDRKRTEKYGLVPNGRKPKLRSLPQIHPVVRAVIRQQPHTIPGLKSTENPNILISQIHIPTVPHVIQVSVGVDTSVGNVARLKQNKKVLSAILALTNVIEKALGTGKNTGKEPGMPITNSNVRTLKRELEVKRD